MDDPAAGTLVYLIAFAVLMAAIGKLVSMAKVGLPEPAAWLGYLIPELVFPVIIALAHAAGSRARMVANRGPGG